MRHRGGGGRLRWIELTDRFAHRKNGRWRLTAPGHVVRLAVAFALIATTITVLLHAFGAAGAAGGSAAAGVLVFDPAVKSLCALLGVFPAGIYGATGDGVTNDEPALTVAVAACSAAGGGTVWLAGGVFMIGFNGLQLMSRVTLKGAGVGVTTLRRHAARAHGIVGLSGTLYGGIRDMSIDGYSHPIGSGGLFTNISGHGIHSSTAVTKSLIENVEIYNIMGYGIGFQEDQTTGHVGNTLRRIHIHDVASDGIDFKNDSDLNRDNVLDDILVERHGLEYLLSSPEGGKVGIDIRGPAILSNIRVREFAHQGNYHGIRYRAGSVGGGNGIGGVETILTNFRIDGGDDPTIGSRGLTLQGEHRMVVANGVVKRVGLGASVNVIAGGVEDEQHTLSSIHFVDCPGGGLAFTVDSPGMTAIGCSARRCGPFGARLDGPRQQLLGFAVYECSVGVSLTGGATDCHVGVVRHDGSNTKLFSVVGAATNATSRIDGALPAVRPSVASTGSLTLPIHSPFVDVTGTVNIGGIAAQRSGKRLTMVFADVLNVNSTTNLRLNGGLKTWPGATLTIECDGTAWHERNRSVAMA